MGPPGRDGRDPWGGMDRTPGEGQTDRTPREGRMDGIPREAWMDGTPGEGCTDGTPGEGQTDGTPGEGRTDGTPGGLCLYKSLICKKNKRNNNKINGLGPTGAVLEPAHPTAAPPGAAAFVRAGARG